MIAARIAAFALIISHGGAGTGQAFPPTATKQREYKSVWVVTPENEQRSGRECTRIHANGEFSCGACFSLRPDPEQDKLKLIPHGQAEAYPTWTS